MSSLRNLAIVLIVAATSTVCADTYTVTAKTTSPSGKLGPELVLIKQQAGKYLGESEDGLAVFELPRLSNLVKQQKAFNIEYEVNPLGKREVHELRKLIVSYPAGDKPTEAQLKNAGFRVLDDFERGSFIVAEAVNVGISSENLSKLESIEHLEFADFDHEITADPTVKEPEIASIGRRPAPVNDPLWHRLWGLEHINVDQGWKQIPTPTKTPETVVAVIDTGVDYRHPDLAANMWVNPREIPGNNIDDDNNKIVDDVFGVSFIEDRTTGDPFDDNGHGTHVAGTVGAVGNNDQGVVGVNRRVKIMALKFLKADRTGTMADAIKCVYYAIDHGAKVLNNSYGGGAGTYEMQEAIEYAKRKNVLFIAAAGNNRSNIDVHPTYPASYRVENVIAVAALRERDNIWGGSNFGRNSVHIAAPGVSIWSTFPNGKYGRDTGTSMAAPHVAGAAALIMRHPLYSGLRWDQVRDLLLQKARFVRALRSRVKNGRVLDLSFLGLSQRQLPRSASAQSLGQLNSTKFFFREAKTFASDGNIASTEIDLPVDSTVHIRANGSATAKTSSAAFTTGFSLSEQANSKMIAESVRINTIPENGDFVSFGSSVVTTLPAGQHRIYWRIRVPSSAGEIQVRAGGTLSVQSFPEE
ncbi:MAG: hypothetical protein CMJ78_19340 [Planctomycetaceae bacterium]|nr:hypothetical protein [Planctomycetaceae bacterium]